MNREKLGTFLRYGISKDAQFHHCYSIHFCKIYPEQLGKKNKFKRYQWKGRTLIWLFANNLALLHRWFKILYNRLSEFLKEFDKFEDYKMNIEESYHCTSQIHFSPIWNKALQFDNVMLLCTANFKASPNIKFNNTHLMMGIWEHVVTW